MADALGHWDIARTTSEDVRHFFRAAPAGVPTQVAFRQSARWEDLDIDRENGVIRSAEHAFSSEGGLAVLFGNLAPEGCVVKTAGVDESILTFAGKARVYESQDAAVADILGNKVEPGDVVVIRYEGPKGGPGMQEMLYPTSYLKSKGLGKACALVTDGRFSGGSSGLSIGHVSPEAAEGGLIALVETGDPILIDIPDRSLETGWPQAPRLGCLARLCGADDQRGSRRRSRCHSSRAIATWPSARRLPRAANFRPGRPTLPQFPSRLMPDANSLKKLPNNCPRFVTLAGHRGTARHAGSAFSHLESVRCEPGDGYSMA
jgi:hypothetical protein